MKEVRDKYRVAVISAEPLKNKLQVIVLGQYELWIMLWEDGARVDHLIQEMLQEDF